MNDRQREWFTGEVAEIDQRFPDFDPNTIEYNRRADAMSTAAAQYILDETIVNRLGREPATIRTKK